MSKKGGYDPKKATFAEKVAFYEKFSGAKKDQKKNMSGKKAGGTKLPCQQKGSAIIYVRDSQNQGLAGISAKLSGQGAKNTGGDDGAASFDNLEPDSYTATITLGDLSQQYCIVESEEGPKTVEAGGSEEFKFKVDRLASLRVTVVRADKEDEKIGNVPIKINGPEKNPKSDTKNTADTGNDKGTVLFEKIPVGKYTVVADLTGQLANDYKRPSSEKVEIKSTDNPKEHKIKLEQKIVYLQLSYKDPEENVLPFPKDFPVKVVFNDNTTKDLKVVDDKGNFNFKVGAGKTKFTLKFEPNQVWYLVHEKTNPSAKAKFKELRKTALPDKDANKLTLDGKLFFSLPKKWELKLTQWDTEKLTLAANGHVDIPENGIGAKNAPGKLTLKPNVLHVRFEYHDRMYRHKDSNKPFRVSIPPVVLNGWHSEGSPDPANPGEPETISNWTIPGSDPDKDCKAQALPWIITKKDDGKDRALDNKMLLSFGWEKAYVFSESKDKRKIEELDPKKDGTDTQKAAYKKLEPSVDRPKYYDLPKLWKSTNYYTRLKDPNENKFFDELGADKIKDAYDKTKPLMFSLDDIVLIHKDGTYLEHAKMDKDKTDADKALSKHSRVTLLYLDSEKKYKVTIYKPRAKAAYHSESEFVKDKDDKYRNVIVDYHPDTRSVVFCNGFYDIYNKRTEGTPDFGKKQVLGARAAKLEDSEVSVKKRFDQNADVTAGYVHRTRVFDLHYLHYCAADDNKVYHALVTHWSALVFSKTADKPAAWTDMDPFTEDIVDTRNYREIGMEKAMSRWNDKDYQYENSTNPSKIVIKSLFLFEAKEVEDPLGTFVSRGGPAHCMLAVGTEGSWATDTELYMRKVAYKEEAIPYGGTAVDPLNNKEDYDGSKTQRLTLAHELGHASGLWDDYVTGTLEYDGEDYPVWSYDQRFPGMPYSIDNLALMKTNHAIRMRYFWGKAKWLNDSTKDPGALKDLLKNEKFKITFSPSGKTALKFSFDKDKYNNIYKPAYEGANVDFGNHATNDLLLYKLGDGETARAITQNQTYDGILVVRTKISVRFIDGTDGNWKWGNPDWEPYFWMEAIKKEITKMLNGKDKYQEYGKFKCACDADNDFKNTYLMFAPHWEIKANEGDAASGGTHFKLIVKKDKDPLDNSKKSEAFAFANDKITVGYNCNNKKIIRYLYGKNSGTDDLEATDLTKISDWVGHSSRADATFEIEDL